MSNENKNALPDIQIPSQETGKKKVSEQKNTALYTPEEARKMLRGMIKKVNESILQKYDNLNGAKDLKDKFLKALAKKIGLGEKDELNVDKLTNKFIEKVDSDQEIQDILKDIDKDIRNNLFPDEKKLIDQVKRSFQYETIVTGKVTSKKSVETHVKNTQDFVKKYQESGGTQVGEFDKMRQGEQQGDFWGNVIQQGVQIAFHLPTSMTQEQAMSFMSLFRPETIAEVGKWNEENSRDKYRNMGAAAQSLYYNDRVFSGSKDKHLFQDVIQNQGKAGLKGILETVKTVKDRNEILKNYQSLQRIVSTLEQTDMMTEEVKKTLTEAGLLKAGETFDNKKRELQGMMKAYEDVMNVMDAFKDFTPEQLDTVVKMVDKAQSNEDGVKYFLITLGILRGIKDLTVGFLTGRIKDAFTSLSKMASTGEPISTAVLKSTFEQAGAAAVGEFLSSALVTIPTAILSLPDLIGLLIGAVHANFADGTKANGITELNGEVLKPSPAATEKVEVKKIDYMETIDQESFLNFLGEDTLIRIRDKYVHTLVRKSDGTTVSAYEAIGWIGSPKSANKNFYKAVLYNMAKEMGSTKTPADVDKLSIDGEKNFMQSGKFLTALKSLLPDAKGLLVDKNMREKIITAMDTVVENAASKATFKSLKYKELTVDGGWQMEKGKERLNRLYVAEKAYSAVDMSGLDAKQEAALEKNHDTALKDMKDAWEAIPALKNLNEEEKKLLSMLVSMRKPQYDKTMKNMEVHNAFVRAGETFKELYVKLNSDQKQLEALKKYQDAYVKAVSIENSLFQMDKKLSPDARAQSDALLLVANLAPHQLGQLINEHGQQSWGELFRMGLSWLDTLNKTQDVLNGVKSAIDLTKNAMNTTKTVEEVVVSGTPVNGRIYMEHQKNYPMDAYEKGKIEELLKSKNLPSDHVIFSTHLTKQDYVEMTLWDDNTWKIIKDGGWLNDGTKSGLGATGLSQELVLAVREYKPFFKDPETFNAFRLHLMYGNANYLDQSIIDRLGVFNKGGRTALAINQHTPAGFLKMILENEAFKDAQKNYKNISGTLFDAGTKTWNSWRNFQDATGMKFAEVANIAEKANPAVLEKFAGKMVTVSRTLIEKKGNPDQLKAVIDAMHTCISIAGNAAGNGKGVFDVLSVLMNAFRPDEKGQNISRSMMDPALRNAFYMKYIGTVPEKETLENRRALLRKVLLADKQLCDLNVNLADADTDKAQYKTVFRKEKYFASECLSELNPNPMGPRPMVDDPEHPWDDK